jgi:hypothetical protein
MATTTYNLDSGQKMIGLGGFGATVTNLSGFAIRANGFPVAAGGTYEVPDGNSTLLLESPYAGAIVTVITADVVGSGMPIQIGTNPISLGLVRLISSVARTYGLTYADLNGEQVGLSASLAVNGPGGVPVALPSIPSNAVTVNITPPVGVTDSSILYYAITSDPAKLTDFQAKYDQGYGRKLITSVGGRLGA